MRAFLGAVSFLTRVPSKARVAEPREIARSVPWFPLVGGLVGGACGVVYALTTAILPPLVAATLAVCAGLLLTGAFHEDGLGDFADAFGGGMDRADVIRILRDPRQGTFGVLAIVTSVLLRVAALSSLGAWAGAAALVAAHALGRSGAVAMMALVEPAKEEGLGAAYVSALAPRAALLGASSGVVVAAAMFGWWAAPATLCAFVMAGAVPRLARGKLGGLSGDVLGAAEQAGEIAVLLVGAAIAFNGWAPLPWWRP